MEDDDYGFGKKRNSSPSQPTLPPFQARYSNSTGNEQDEQLQLYPLKPCLRVKSESSNCEQQKGSLSNSKGLRWCDIAGNGELVEVHEYEPR
jgi:hypothetical protein